MTKVDESLAEARNALTAGRVFGEPFEKNGVTVITAAAVRGGGGAGAGDGDDRSGSGGGFGMMARPVGAYQIRGDEVVWIPAADTTRVILAGQAVAIVALLVLRSVLRRRAKSR